MSEIPETYFITGESRGLTRERHPDVLGQYDLVATSYRSIPSLIYKKNTTQTWETVYWMFNVTDDGDWIVGSEHREVLLRATVPDHGFHAPPDKWRLSIRTADNTYRLVEDTSVRVRAEIGKVIFKFLFQKLNFF